MPYDVGLPLVLADQCRDTDASPGVADRLAGALGLDAVAGVTISWSTRDRPWSETANCCTVLAPAFRWTWSFESWYVSKLPVIGKLCVRVMTVPLTARPMRRLLTPGNRPDWNA